MRGGKWGWEVEVEGWEVRVERWEVESEIRCEEKGEG